MVRGSSLKIAALAVLVWAQAGFAGNFAIDPVHSSVNFKIRHLVSKVTGNFTKFSGDIYYDAAHPEKTTINATIDAASINTNNEARDKHLRNPDFFEVEKYPSLSFKSKSTTVKDGILMVSGDFTMHGVTKALVLPVEVLGVGTNPRSGKPVAGFAAKLTLDRTEYGMSYNTTILGKEVEIDINIEAGGE